jgi:hypothetical protein|tara:strand:+ start:53 stop:469 length:417 start_codon:yes stop_codon:yes gene_type:complete
MIKIKKLVNVTDAAYIAGLFDGEGSVDFAKRKEKRGNVQAILMRIEMTDENVLNWVHETLGVGTVRKRNRSPSRKAHWKDAWVYSVRFRDALHVCKILWPYTIVKLHKIEQIIDHYEPDIQGLDDNIVDLALERELRK